MVDVVDQATRSRMMSGIRGRNTKPEKLVRSLLHRRGFRFRICVKDLPGKPDVVLPRYRCVIFVNGCFWHGHNCALFKLPGTRTEFWKHKIEKNKENDQKSVAELIEEGWRVCIIWECSIRANRKNMSPIIDLVTNWLRVGGQFLETNSGIESGQS